MIDGGEDYVELLVSLVPPWLLCVEFAVEWGGKVVDSVEWHRDSLDFVLVAVVRRDARVWRLGGRSGNRGDRSNIFRQGLH